MEQPGLPAVKVGPLTAFTEQLLVLGAAHPAAARIEPRIQVVAALPGLDRAVALVAGRDLGAAAAVCVVGGLAVQAEARALAAALDRPLIVVATELGRAVLAPGAARVLVDPEIVGGWGGALAELLAAATALAGWRVDEERGHNGPAERYQHWAALSARSLVYAATECAAALGRREPAALIRLTQLLLLQLQLDAALGHQRASVGPERAVAAALGVDLGAALVWFAEQQGQPSAHLRQALQAVGAASELPVQLRADARARVRAYAEQQRLRIPGLTDR